MWPRAAKYNLAGRRLETHVLYPFKFIIIIHSFDAIWSVSDGFAKHNTNTKYTDMNWLQLD